MMKKVFRFDNPRDMITLAQEIQTQVYWHKAYYIEGQEEDGKNSYKYFWDQVENEMDSNLTAVEFSDDYETVKFIYK